MLFKVNQNTIITCFGLLALLIVSLLSFNQKNTSTHSAIQPNNPTKQADFFMTRYNIISTDENGEAVRWLSGKKLEHYSDDITALTEPTLQFSQNEQHWLLSAKNGNIHGEETISFQGDVNIHQLSGKSENLNISTEHIQIDLENNQARTDQAVNVSDENGNVSATGMSIHFDDHRLRLLSNVKGRYDFE